jgi:hypothetical protein
MFKRLHIQKRIFVSLALVIALVFILSNVAYAQDSPPLLPAFYTGQVKTSGGEAVDAGTVKAFIGGEQRGSIDFVSGSYQDLVVEGDASSIDQPVTFKVSVNGVDYPAVSNPAQVLWRSGALSGADFSNIDLTINLASGGSSAGGGDTSSPDQSTVDTSEQTPAPSGDVPAAKVIKLVIGQLSATVGDSPYTLDAAPFIDGSRTLVPIRFVSEALGAKVDWDAATRQVTITDGAARIVLTIGSGSALVNDSSQSLDAPPRIDGGRTFVPLRFVSETLGAKVDYDASARSITITR